MLTHDHIIGLILILPFILGCIILFTIMFTDRDFWLSLLIAFGICVACGAFVTGLKLLGLL